MGLYDPIGAGLGSAGALPATTSKGVAIAKPVARRYEGKTGDWAYDATTGQYLGVTAVQQGFALALCVRAGDIQADPDVGNTLHLVTDIVGPATAADIEDRVRRSVPIASYLADGLAEIARIEHEVIPTGGIKVAVYYRDFTEAPTAPLRAVNYIA